MSKVTIIFGKRGTGKTALNACFALKSMLDRQRFLSCSEVLNIMGLENLIKTMPFKHCTYANFDLKNTFGSERYFVDPFKMLMPNENLDYDIFLPCASFHIMEGQIYWNSKYKLNPYSTAFIENSRHNDFDIFIDVQRPKKIHLDIREIADTFITILNLGFEYNEQGKIKKCIWNCLEFDDYSLVEEYILTKKKELGIETTYEFNGCIFDYYDSKNNRSLFYNSYKTITLNTSGTSEVSAPDGYYLSK